jgi:hypothetical protein
VRATAREDGMRHRPRARRRATAARTRWERRRDGESRQLGGPGRKREQPTPLHPLFPDDLCLHRSVASTR